MGWIFGSVAALLAGLYGVAWHSTAGLQREMGKVVEETREELLALRLEQALQRVKTQDTGPALFAEASELLDQFKSQAPTDDPSEAEHEHDEDNLGLSVRRQIQALFSEPRLSANPAAWNELESTVTALRRETEHESEEAVRDATTAAGRTRSTIFTAMLLFFGVLLWILQAVSRQVVSPILELTNVAKRIGAGQTNARVPTYGSGEIGELGHAFNAMASQVEHSKEDLEQRIQVRTQQFLRAARLADFGTLAAGIAHEINNPLASIAASAEGLERRIADGRIDHAQQREYLQVIASEAFRAHAIASRLLEFARHDPGPSTPSDLMVALREIQLLLAPRLEARAIQLKTFSPASSLVVMGNTSEFKQVLHNLLGNAIDASPHGGTIELRCMREGSLAVVEIQDQGPGIAPADKERIFDPFFTTKEPGKGTGLGLSIVHRIVESYGGSVDCVDTPTGALFRWTMPLLEGGRA